MYMFLWDRYPQRILDIHDYLYLFTLISISFLVVHSYRDFFSSILHRPELPRFATISHRTSPRTLLSSEDVHAFQHLLSSSKVSQMQQEAKSCRAEYDIKLQSYVDEDAHSRMGTAEQLAAELIFSHSFA